MSSMNARETFCWWPYGGFFQKIIIFKGHLTKKNANVDTFCQHVGDGKFPKIFRFWCSMTLFRLVIFKARSSYRKHKQTLVVQDNGVLKEGHTAFQLIPGLKWKKVHLQLNAFCHSFGFPIPKSLIFIGPMCTWGPIIGLSCLSFYLYLWDVFEIQMIETCFQVKEELCYVTFLWYYCY